MKYKKYELSKKYFIRTLPLEKIGFCGKDIEVRIYDKVESKISCKVWSYLSREILRKIEDSFYLGD
jgi:hypothetical protein